MAFGRDYVWGSPQRSPELMQGQGWFLLFGKALWADRLYSCDLSGGFALYAGDGGGFALGRGYLLVVGRGLA